ncbi:MAG: hypothetical protein JST85_28815 [Acidobacteria bacterium]|nr:hypothetical protein [Acidobacteriota bacterium]
MKKTALMLGVAMAMLFLPAVVSRAYAQSESSLRAKIPFSFTVCREQLPAGTYTIKHPTGNTHTLVVKGADNRSVDIACVNNMPSSKPVAEGTLIFNRYGNAYFLAETWWPGDEVGHSLVKTEKELALIKESPTKKPEKVIIKIVKPEKSN